jgi:hypothetical protein
MNKKCPWSLYKSEITGYPKIYKIKEFKLITFDQFHHLKVVS